MKILITGAGGMLGTDLSSALHSHHQILGLGRSPVPHLNIPFRQMDLTNSEAVGSIIKSFGPNIIFHTAAMTHVDGCEKNPEEAIRQNAGVTRTLVKACEGTRTFLIFFSTDYVFDGKKKGEYVEEDKINPKSHYGESKALAEKEILDSKAHAAIFRVCWLYGLKGRSFPRTILEKAREQQAFEVVSDQVGRPTYTRDIAKAFKELLNNQPILEKMDRQIFNLANSGQCSWAEFASFLLANGGYEKATVTSISSKKLARPAARPANSVLSLDKTEKVLGLKLQPWQDAALEFMQEFAMIRRSSGEA